MQMSVNRRELIHALEDQRDKVAAIFQVKVDKAQAKLDELNSGQSVPDWLREVADLVENTAVTVRKGNPLRGNGESFQVFPDAEADRPKMARILTSNQPWPPEPPAPPGVPAFPSNDAAMREQREAGLAQHVRKLETAIQPYEAAIALLNMSDDDKVGVDRADYHRLLGGSPRPSRSRAGVDYDDDEDEYR